MIDVEVFKNIFGKGGKGKLFPGEFGGFRRDADGTTTLVGKKSGGASPESKAAGRAKILSRGFTAVSAFGPIGEGFAKAKALKAEGRALDFEARQISLRGQREAINESIRATEAIGSQVVSSSTSLTGSSAGTILSEFDQSNTNRNIIQLNAEQRSLLARDAANKARRQAKLEKILGFVKAGEKIGTAFAGGVG